MEFCPECGTMLFPKDNKLTCKCGFEKDLSDANEYSVEEKIEVKETVKVVEDIDKFKPSTDSICPKCGNKRAYYEIKQTRSADEAETRFFTCTECKYTWREYD